MDGYDINKLSISLPQTLYLAHTQAGKTELKAMGCGQGKESRVLTIHEAQGLASKNVVIVRTASKKAEIYNSIQHAVVAITRHTENCIYLTRIAEVHLPGDCGIFPVAHSREIREKPLTTHNYVSTWLRSQREESDTSRRALAAATVRHFGLPSVTINHGATEKKSTLRVRPAINSEAKGRGDKKGCRRETTGNPDFTRKRREAPDGERSKGYPKSYPPGTKIATKSRAGLQVDGIETPKRAETPEGFRRSGSRREFAGRLSLLDEIARPSPLASKSPRPPEPSIGTPKRSSCEKSGTEEEFGAINRAATKIVCLARDAKDELEALRT
ncbi:hypothetical protein EVAR_84152_1 [Eumeta japonica]|uniref:(+)RNA virus helicase C-terminal domain-containing protein n=1 Tax=Eumeta variegata TaxID=151549 RepID=A0A4C2ACH3_EUMVA|nr:hypothetical protein EVAR_84152_1 [Eumeta japonica]